MIFYFFYIFFFTDCKFAWFFFKNSYLVSITLCLCTLFDFTILSVLYPLIIWRYHTEKKKKIKCSRKLWQLEKEESSKHPYINTHTVSGGNYWIKQLRIVWHTWEKEHGVQYKRACICFTGFVYFRSYIIFPNSLEIKDRSALVGGVQEFSF